MDGKKLLPSLASEVEVIEIDPPDSLASSHTVLHLPILVKGNIEWGVVCFISKEPLEGEMIFLKLYLFM